MDEGALRLYHEPGIKDSPSCEAEDKGKLPKRQIRLIGEKEAFREAVDLAERRGYKARLRLFCLLKEKNPVPYDQAMNRLNLTPAVLKPLEEAGLIG